MGKKSKPNKKSKSKGSRRTSSRLEEHRRHRKVLTPPLLGFPNMAPFDWRLRQPDMLLMAALVHDYPGEWRVVDALEALDAFVPKGDERIIDGRLTRFEIVPQRLRPAARRALMARDRAVLPEALGHALALFEDCPGSWLYEDWAWETEHDSALGAAYLRELLAHLRDGRGEFAVHARMLSLGRYLAHGRIAVSSEARSFELLGRYPTGCNADEQRQARQIAKLTYDMLLQTQEDTGTESQQAREWGRSFWQRSARLAQSLGPTKSQTP